LFAAYDRDPGMLWDVASGQVQLRVPSISTDLSSPAISADGKTLVGRSVRSRPGTFKVWDLARKATLFTLNDQPAADVLRADVLRAEKCDRYCTAVSPDGRMLAYLRYERNYNTPAPPGKAEWRWELTVSDVMAGRERFTARGTFLGEPVFEGAFLTFRPDGKVLAGKAGPTAVQL